MLNPVLSNFRIQFGEQLFPQHIVEKYDKFLFHKNYPLKNIRAYLHETIQTINIPGEDFQTLTVSGLSNLINADIRDFPHTTVNRTYPGTSPLNEVVDGIMITVTFKNSILNWIYLFEWMYKYYKRTREAHEFYVNLIMLDSAEIPMINFRLLDCYVAQMPGLEFAYNEGFSESKTFDMSFVFNRFDVNLIVPGFDSETIHLK